MHQSSGNVSEDVNVSEGKPQYQMTTVLNGSLYFLISLMLIMSNDRHIQRISMSTLITYGYYWILFIILPNNK